MTTISFPSSPVLNQVYSYNGKSWTYNGTGWLITAGNIATTVTLPDQLNPFLLMGA